MATGDASKVQTNTMQSKLMYSTSWHLALKPSLVTFHFSKSVETFGISRDAYTSQLPFGLGHLILRNHLKCTEQTNHVLITHSKPPITLHYDSSSHRKLFWATASILSSTASRPHISGGSTSYGSSMGERGE